MEAVLARIMDESIVHCVLVWQRFMRHVSGYAAADLEEGMLTVMIGILRQWR